MKRGFATRKSNIALRFMARARRFIQDAGLRFIFAERMLHFLLHSAPKYAIINCKMSEMHF